MRKIVFGAIVFLLAASGASGAKWGPTWSEVSGNLYSRTQMHRTAAIIKQIDGQHERGHIVKVEPGKRTLVIQSPDRKGFSGTDETMALDIEPCKRYYINAQFKSGSGRDWEPVIAKVEKIAGCKVP